MSPSNGEQLHAERRRRFWLTLGAIGLRAMPIGAGIGFVAASERTDFGGFWRALPDAVAALIIGASVILFTIGTWRFIKAIDEVELVDNLWGSTGAFYIYAVLFPAWWALAAAGVAPAPNQWAIFLTSLGGGSALYFWRKLRVR
jgi:hypothetical protein